MESGEHDLSKLQGFIREDGFVRKDLQLVVSYLIGLGENRGACNSDSR